MTSRRPITIEDLYALRFVGDPQVSPDGRRVAFVVTVIDRDADVYRSHLWLASPDGGEARQHTRGAHRDASPRWSPDGRLLAFVSDRSGEKHVWVIPADGGEAQRVTDGPPVAAAPAWSPDGRWLAYSAKAGARHDPEEPRVVDRVRYKADGEGLWDGRWKQIFIVAAAADARAGVQITTETCDHLDPAWSPDGRLLAYVANPDRGADFTNVSDLWVVPVTEIGAAGAARRLTRSLGPVQSPSWSPDGSRIAYFGHDNACMNATNMGVWIAFADGDAGPADPVNLTAGYDRSFSHHLISDMRAHPSPGVPTWTPDGRRILCLVADGGTTQVCAVEVPAFPPSQPSPPSPPFAADRIPGSPEIRSTNFSGGSEGREASTRTSPRTGVEARSSVRILTEGRRDIYGYSFDRTCGRVALAISDPLVPGDVWAGEVEARGDGAALGGDLLRRLTALNAPLLDQVEMSVPERFEFQGAGGLKEEGWVMRPVGYRASDRYPTILQIHGGPHAAYGEAFFHEFQVLAARGFALVYTNPRGSQGYGQDFTAGTRHDWGGKDYQDIMAGLDHAIAAFDFIDSSRLGVAGGSYGGFMTNWIVGHTDRFKAAVSMRDISNHLAQWGTSDLAYMKGFWEFPGEPWQNLDYYWTRSPMAYVENIKTPLLLIHSEQDLRCPIGESEQLFVALRKLGREVLFIRMPGESHDLSRAGKPRRRVARLEWIARWLERFLPSSAPQEAPAGARAAVGAEARREK